MNIEQIDSIEKMPAIVLAQDCVRIFSRIKPGWKQLHNFVGIITHTVENGVGGVQWLATADTRPIYGRIRLKNKKNYYSYG